MHLRIPRKSELRHKSSVPVMWDSNLLPSADSPALLAVKSATNSEYPLKPPSHQGNIEYLVNVSAMLILILTHTTDYSMEVSGGPEFNSTSRARPRSKVVLISA